MSKRYPIKWSEADLKEAKRVLKNFNAKLARVEKKNPKAKNNLPKFSKHGEDEYGNRIVEFTDRLSLEQLQEMIYSRQDFNREINALKRFSRRGAENLITIDDTDNNIKITKWQNEEMNRRLVHINRRRNQRRNEISEIIIKDVNEQAGYRVAEMGNQALKELNPLTKSFKTMSNKDMHWKFNTILAESNSNYFNEKDERLRENYIKSLTENYNEEDIKDIIENIRKMDSKDFVSEFYAQGGNFEYSYFPDDEQYQAYVEQLRGIWSKKKSKRFKPPFILKDIDGVLCGEFPTIEKAKEFIKGSGYDKSYFTLTDSEGTEVIL